jgi:hypothetical protein
MSYPARAPRSGIDGKAKAASHRQVEGGVFGRFVEGAA